MINDTFRKRGRYDRDPVVAHPHGDDVELQRRLRRDEHYNSIYVTVGEINTQQYIDSFKTGCSLKAIIDRCQLLPVHDKIRYLQQTSDGVSADLSCMPKDGVEAYKMLFDLRKNHPDIIERMNKGETFDAILKSYVSDPTPVSSEKQTEVESEVNSNG